MIRYAAFFLAALTLFGETPETLLRRARARLLETIEQLPHYTCTQTIDRAYFTPTRPDRAAKSCDDVLADRSNASLALTRTDRLRLDVMVAGEGFEVYSWPGDRVVGAERPSAFTGDGPMGTGAFGPFLMNIFATPGVSFFTDGEHPLDGRPAAQYRYRVPLEASHYRVVSGGSGTARVVAFDGRFWIDPVSGELLRLVVRTAELPPATGNCEATSTVDFSRVLIGANEYLLPSRTGLRIVRRDAFENENTTTYAACHEFRGESTIRFDGSEEVPGASAAALTPADPLPASIALTLALAAPIDTATAAAGDRVIATLVKPAANRKRTVATPAGTKVRGRITALQHRMERDPYFAITIEWDGIERGGRWLPFGAKLDEPAIALLRHKLTAQATAPRADSLIFASAGPTYVVPAGYATRWITIAPHLLH